MKLLKSIRNDRNERKFERINDIWRCDLEEREKFEERYRKEQKVLQKLRSKKRFRRRQCEKAGLKNLKDMVKKMTYMPDKENKK